MSFWFLCTKLYTVQLKKSLLDHMIESKTAVSGGAGFKEMNLL